MIIKQLINSSSLLKILIKRMLISSAQVSCGTAMASSAWLWPQKLAIC